MPDFSIGKIMNTFFITANTAAAKELCNKIVPSGVVQAGNDGALIFPPVHDELLCKLGLAIVGAGLSMEDSKGGE